MQPYYKSSITKDQIIAKGLGSIRINTLAFDEPYTKMNDEGILTIFPILSLIPVRSAIWKNTVYLENNQFAHTTLQKGDIENILVSEIKNSGMFDEVEYQGLPKDYDIKGRVNLTIEYYAHFSGLGMMLYQLSVIGILTLPAAIVYYTCDAHFDVISAKDNKVIFSKDYLSKNKKWWGFLFYDISIFKTKPTAKVARVFGEDIFPVIVKEFVDDLQHNLKPQSSVTH